MLSTSTRTAALSTNMSTAALSTSRMKTGPHGTDEVGPHSFDWQLPRNLLLPSPHVLMVLIKLGHILSTGNCTATSCSLLPMYSWGEGLGLRGRSAKQLLIYHSRNVKETTLSDTSVATDPPEPDSLVINRYNSRCLFVIVGYFLDQSPFVYEHR